MGNQAEPTVTTDVQASKARKLKYWGLGLVGIGTVLEFSFYAGPSRDYAGLVAACVLAGMVCCGIGLSLFALAKEQLRVMGAFALLPVLGPVLGFLIVVIISASVKKSETRATLNYLSLILIPIFIFVAIAIPNFLTYGAKARQSEARVNLGGIFAAATVLKEERKTFVISNINQLDFVPIGRSRYSLWYAVNGVPTMIPSANLIKGPCDVTTPPLTVKVAASATSFTAAAKGNMDNDATCDEWSINEKKELVHTLDDMKN